MNKGALALLIHGGTENWSAERWKQRFDEVCRDRRVLMLPDAAFDPAEIHYAAVWKPAPGELAAFPNLRVIFNLGAGVDALMADKSLPKVPLVRVAVGDLTYRMTEYVVLHVLMHHRQELYLRACQREKRWAPKFQRPSSEVSVGIMGLGNARIRRGAGAPRISDFASRAGADSPKADRRRRLLSRAGAARCVSARGPTSWSASCRSRRTRGRFSIADLFAKLYRDGPLGAPVLINAGRGGLQNEADILDCLDDGTLGAASLDVFATEPLPADSRFWTHPKVVLTPHNASDTDPDEISKYVARQIERFEAGGALENVVDRARGY